MNWLRSFGGVNIDALIWEEMRPSPMVDVISEFEKEIDYMRRTGKIETMDQTEIIPRCAPNGVPSVTSTPNGNMTITPPMGAFFDRVQAAKEMLREKLPLDDIRERHGSVVLRQAQWEMKYSGRV